MRIRPRDAVPSHHITLVVSVTGVILVFGAMAAASQRPLAALVIAGALPFAIAAFLSPVSRLAAVLLGAVLVFQSDADGPKYAYLLVAAVCFTISALAIVSDVAPELRIARPFVVLAALTGIAIFVSYSVSRSNAVSGGSWFRDVLPYLLLTTLPIVGIDAGRRFRRKTLDLLIVSMGVLAAVGFATDYLERRGVSSLGVGHILLATPTLAALGFVHALVLASRRDARSNIWMISAVTIATLLIVTGTRTNLVLITAFPAIMGAERKGRVPPSVLARLLVPVVAFTALLVPFLGGYIIDNPQFLSGRLDATLSVIRGRSSSGDQSLDIRERAYEWARSQFDLAHWFGTGPGHVYPDGTVSLDTPWLVLAKFGIIGTAAVVLYLVVGTGSAAVRSRRQVGHQDAYTTLRGWATVLLFLTPFGPWSEDKGLALGLALIMALLVVCTREPEPPPLSKHAGGSGPSRRAPRRVPRLGNAETDPVNAREQVTHQ